MKGKCAAMEIKLKRKVRQIEKVVKHWESRLEDIENEHKSSLSDYTEKIKRLEGKYKNLKRKLKCSEAKVKDLAAKLSSNNSSCDSEEAGEFENGIGTDQEVQTENVIPDQDARRDDGDAVSSENTTVVGVGSRKREKSLRTKDSDDDPGPSRSKKILRILKSNNVIPQSKAREYQAECGEPVILLEAVSLPESVEDDKPTSDSAKDTENRFECNFCHKSKATVSRLIEHLRKHTGCEPPMSNKSIVEVDRPIRACKICKEEFYVKKKSNYNNPDFTCSKCRSVTFIEEHPEATTPVPNDIVHTALESASSPISKSPHKITSMKGSPVHKCQTCRKNLSSASSLRRHAQIHLKPKPKPKPAVDCGVNRILRKKNIIAVNPVDSSAKKFMCRKLKPEPAVECGVNEIQKKQNIIAVNPVDSSVKKFKCRICKLDFKLWNSFEEHVTGHEEASGVEERLPPVARGRPSIKRISCLKCHRKFPSKDEQIKHFAISHAWVKYKPFKCSICLEGFTSRDSLKRHQHRVHD